GSLRHQAGAVRRSATPAAPGNRHGAEEAPAARGLRTGLNTGFPAHAPRRQDHPEYRRLDWNLVFVIAMFAVFIALLFTGYPLAFVLGGTAVIFALLGEIMNTYFDIWVDADLGYMKLVISRIFGVMSNYSFVPVPMFI